MLISTPEDYGLSPGQTLDHRHADPLVDGFEAFWEAFREEVQTLRPHLEGRIDGGINPVVLRSIRSVRLAGRLECPEGPPRGAVVATHGASAPDGFEEGPEPWTALGLATLRVRVRGYPPSTMDVEDRREQWILSGIESPEAWIVLGAVADVMQAYRCLRALYGPDLPIGLHGESLGGGLAVIAAAQLARLGDPPFRLALGLPSLGAWSWRRGRYCRGTGGLVNMVWESWRDHRDELERTLGLFDAAAHAPMIDAPTLCKLATRDDVVPAPAAAAVFNAIRGTKKWRFVTRFGHFDGGLADARRHVLFDRLHPPFLDPGQDAGGIAKCADLEIGM